MSARPTTLNTMFVKIARSCSRTFLFEKRSFDCQFSIVHACRMTNSDVWAANFFNLIIYESELENLENLNVQNDTPLGQCRKS